ncbi:MAG: AmmeMemoRadiSam system radical SAM enzyme [Prevotella sp.]|nr:AmmeMemoRadiSam system radical SAM enzyme [Prevotella sp.]
MKECLYYSKIGDGRVKCELCPHACVLKEGQRGICGSRRNGSGVLWTDVYGRPCALADDPIEKKPLYEFHPGTRCLSLSCSGCNMRCLNCQNHKISQALPDETEYYMLELAGVVDLAERKNLPGIAYTYTEPLTYYEYIYDIASLARKHGLWNILVSAGYICDEPLRKIASLIDAANIDLKSFSDTIYRKISGARLTPVLNTLLTLHEMGVHLEITNLLIPGVNDDMNMIREMCRWLRHNDLADCPLHLSRFFPCYKMQDSYPTPLATLYEARQIALDEGIKRIYLGNV